MEDVRRYDARQRRDDGAFLSRTNGEQDRFRARRHEAVRGAHAGERGRREKLADAFAPLYASFPAEQKALADSTFRKWLHPEPGKARARKHPGKADGQPASSAGGAQ